MKTFKLTSLAENTTFRHNCLAQHGQSILIEVDDYKLLFDVGEVPGAVEHNLTQLGISLDDIDDVLISHRHIDHIGGLKSMLPKFDDQRLFLPLQMGESHIKNHPYKYNFLARTDGGEHNLAISEEDSNLINEYKNITIVDDNGFELSNSIYTTGCVGDSMKEQSVVIDQKEMGIIVVLGCSHPSVETLIKKAIEVTGNDKVRGIVGGMHYTDYDREEMRFHAENIKSMSPDFIMPGHCTTVEGCRVLSEVIGENVVLSKTGTFGTGNSVLIGEDIKVEFV
ncbi:MAG: MBL fold metallo-hydrolase [Candidatus Pacebacteria bacterium]|jgi:7,8-dihydropterin-6-yl-methyl-4-(beta-D-ribofuranosyl)aminobenzene 5'-phosphate synthase|nr:MBL fold metallo-hydrolase [Candidatus Paceibacterota bacterium]MBT6921780.1 MBL fold metallo-hydrolase [Candidatus Paceibacterota bacterium]